MEIKNLALLGRGIAHSLSPSLYREIYHDQQLNYKLIDIEKESDLPSLDVLMKNLDGLNITSPYKEFYINDVIIKSDEIKEVGAINCIARLNTRYLATNTDYSALEKLLPTMIGAREIVILGDGVMSRLIQLLCKKKNLQYRILARKINLEQFNKFTEGDIVDHNTLIINCCSREYSFKGQIGEKSLFWDLNYKQQEHIKYFHNNPSYIDGYSLLKMQAQDAAAFWSQAKN